MRYVLIIILCLFAPASVADWAETVPVGSPFPAIEAADQHGKIWSNSELLGGHGLVFFFNRSTSW
jgi:hypothetical protein